MSVYLETNIEVSDIENQLDNYDKEEMLELIVDSIGAKRVLEILKIEAKQNHSIDLAQLSIAEKARALTSNLGEEVRMKEHLELFYD